MEQRTTDKLRDISVKTNHNEYSKETFNVIYNILQARGKNVSPQTKQEELTEEINNKMTLRGFFSFQFMISSKLIQSSYIIGAFAVTYVNWILFMRSQLFIVILSIIVGNLFWRLACEIAINSIRINKQLGLIHQELKRNINN